MFRRLFFLNVFSIVVFYPFLCLSLLTSCKGQNNFKPESSKIAITKSEMVKIITSPTTIEGKKIAFLRPDMKGYHQGVLIEGRNITLAPYEMGKYEVTYNLWKEVRDLTKETYTIVSSGVNGSKNATFDEKGKQPVGKITWRDVIVWLNAYSEATGLKPVYYTDEKLQTPHRTSDIPDKLFPEKGSIDNPYVDWESNGYRLPTEAEWEVAARGGDMNAPDWNFAYSGVKGYTEKDGNVIFTPYDSEYTEEDGTWPNFMWISFNSGEETHNVGTRKPNRLGLYDMSGNVEEYCWDFYGNYQDGNHAFDPSTPIHGFKEFSKNRVRRGGSYIYNNEFALVSYRGHVSMTSGYASGIGFRLARTLKN